MPGDTIQFVGGEIKINNRTIKKSKVRSNDTVRCGSQTLEVDFYNETLPNGLTYTAAYNKYGTMQNSDKYIVPIDHYFFLGDNRDCSKDSRFLTSVGYVPKFNLVGKAKIIFFSNDTLKGSFLKFWNWQNSLRFERFFKILK